MTVLTSPDTAEAFVFPLSFAQERLWFLDQLEGAGATYNVPTAVRLTGQLKPTILQQALTAMAERHEVLRTRFQRLEGAAVQVIETETRLSLQHIDLRRLSEVDQEAELQRQMAQAAQTPFDLTQAPLIRATLIQVAGEEHILLITLHHIICDAWSIGIVIHELTTLYQAFSLGRPSPLPELEIQYADFAQWQRQWLQGETLAQQLAYWKQYLAGAPPLLELPSDRPRPPVQSFRGRRQYFELPLALTAQLKQLSQDTETTLFMVLFAAFNLLLHRYSGEDDIVVGTPIANRNRTEIEPLIGFFVNTLVLRTQFVAALTFRDLLKQVRQNALEAYSHQDLPFEQLVEALQPQRNLSHSPLFQVWFVLQNAPTARLELSDLTLTPLRAETAVAKFDMALSLSETDQGLIGHWEYNTDLFEADAIKRMIGHYQQLLTAIVADPDAALARLPLLTTAEQQQLAAWNHTAAAYPQTEAIHQLFEAQVEQTPAAIAATYGDRQLSYQALNHRANQLARHLQALGVGPDVLVGVCVDRSLDMAVAILAILKAGGAYAPLDPTYPQERLAYMLEDAAVPVLLTQAALAETLPMSYARVVELDTDWPEIAAQSPENLDLAVSPDNLAYVIYTSGSTGQPKGVLVNHQGIGNLVRAQQAIFQIDPDSRVLQFASFSFDAAVSEFFTALTCGAQLVLASREALMPGLGLEDTLNHHRITHVTLPPSALAILSPDTLPHLKQVIVAGETCPAELAQTWSQHRRMINAYGPCEATVCAAAKTLEAGGGDRVPGACPIGQPIANTQIYLLDRYLQPVPIGVPGEIYIRSPGLARGYLNQPDLTAERFIQADQLGLSHLPDRLYKTGDLGRYLANGDIEFLGRIDHQVKVRGFRIELGEVEAALTQHPQVQAAVAAVQQAQNGDRRLVAYVVLAAGSELTAAALRQALKQTLPDYMTPGIIMFLDALPLSPNGKVDRHALPTPDQAVSQATPFVAPTNPTEQAIAEIFAQVLGVEQVGIHHNFFELGGHSLLATQVISRLRQVFDLELPLGVLFESPTVAELSQAAQAAQAHSSAEAPAIAPGPQTSDLPLSWAQERLWFLDQLEGVGGAYNIPAAVRLQGPLQVERLAQALRIIAQRHQILHTRFDTVNGAPIQVIEPDTKLGLNQIDLRHLAPPTVEAEIQRCAAQEARTPFDLSQAPLIRATLLRLPHRAAAAEEGEAHNTGLDDSVLLVTMHHIISDGWSMRVMMRELSATYQALCDNQPPPLAPLAIQYADFAQWQRRWLQGAAWERQLTYWKQYLADAPARLDLPTDRPRPPRQTFNGSRHAIALSPEVTEQLQQLCRQTDSTLFMVLLTAFMVLLHRYSGQDDIVVGSPIANRNRTELEPLIGFFVNTLALRARFERTPTFLEALQQIRQAALNSYEHQDLPFEQLVEALQPERHLSYSPLFQVMFSLQNTPNQPLELSGVTAQPLPSNTVFAKFDLTLSLQDTDKGVRGAWEYNTDLFDANTIERMSGHFQALLKGIVANPQTPVTQLPLLTTAEHQWLSDWNRTAVEYPQQPRIYQDFEAQVRRTPAAIALICGPQRLTYEQLNQQANQLAHYLQNQGVGPETRVGICVERSVEMMVALLGALKAGAAYVPLDPTHPAERLRFILADAQVTALITQTQFQAQFSLDTAAVDTAAVDTVAVDTAAVINLDADWGAIAQHPDHNPNRHVKGEHLAYLIYTSGSTGQPKGVMVEHRQVTNFFTGMDQRLGGEPPGTWLAITTIAFDISVLELFWTLGRGFRVVLQRQQDLGAAAQSASSREAARTAAPTAPVPTTPPQKPLDFSLFYFGSEHEQNRPRPGDGHYRLLMEGAQFADQNGFSAVWTPERHFHEFGGVYPNPAVAAAAIAAVTQHIHIRAGSVVLPLHSPLRVAEEWAFVDHLSQGRVGISIASGWQPDDFVLAPGDYEQRKQIMVDRLHTVHKLWRGESICLANGNGKPIQVRTFPQPIQPELPTWLTAAGNPETFRLAGELGCSVLTHLLGQSTDELAAKIARYRQAWRRCGHPGSGHVTLMLHTFVGDDLNQVRETVRQPLTEYLGQSASLIEKMIQGSEFEGHLADFSAADRTALLAYSFERYFQTSGLLGTPETCLAMLAKLRTIDVDEVGCLIDFGVDVETVLAHLPKLKRLMDLSREAGTSGGPASDRQLTIPDQIRQHQVTHLQCTPSQARLLTLSSDGLESLKCLKTLLLGGEALPSTLARQLRQILPAQIHNMYGPTEAAIWASTQPITAPDQPIAIGRPIANTQFYLLDQRRQPVPIGVPGELYIGGAGVARGYWRRPALTAERFLDGASLSELAAAGASPPPDRLYKTGDQGRYRADGAIEFLGRMDDQVKLQGFRIELGEIEAVLNQHPQLQQTVVIVDRPDGGEPRLVAYGVPHTNAQPPTTAALRQWLQTKLPDYMTPKLFAPLATLPLTPNGKVNRRALPAPAQVQLTVEPIPPRNPIERRLAQIWRELLNLESVGVQDNFFDLGGRSLLAVRLMSRLKTEFGQTLPLATLFQAPTIEGLAQQLGAASPQTAASTTLAPEAPQSNQQAASHNLNQPSVDAPPPPIHLPACIAPLQPQGERRPCFLIPGTGGTVLQFHPLAHALNQDQPLYGLQTPGLEVDGVRLDRVEAMARYYLPAVQTVQPHGPYCLGGHSLGGKVAFEMARQLLQQGQSVHRVIIFDATAPLPTASSDLSDWDEALWLMAIAEAAISGFGLTVNLTVDQLRGLEPDAQRRWLQQQLVQAGVFSPQDQPAQLENLVQLAKVHHTSAITYQCPEQLPIPLRVFKIARHANAPAPHSLLEDPTLGWDQVSTLPVVRHDISGDHYTLLSQPHVQQIAQILDQGL